MTTSYNVTYWQAHQTTLDAGSPFIIADTASAIQGALNSLAADAHITQIQVASASGTVQVSVTQLSHDSAALAILKNGTSGTTAAIQVVDTAAAIQSNFALIGTDSQVGAIWISNNLALTLSASQVRNNIAAVGLTYDSDGLTPASIVVRDNATNLTNYLSSIESVGSRLSQVVVSNNAVMTLSATQVAADSTALAATKWANGSTTNLFAVTDSGANIGTNLAALAGLAAIKSITVNDNAAVSISIANISGDATTLAKLANSSGTVGAYTLQVRDTASDISTALSTGNAALVSNSHVAHIVVSDSLALTVSVSEIATYSSLLTLTTNSGGGAYTLLVQDSAADIAGAISSLNGNSKVAKIEISDNEPVALTGVTSLTTYSTALGKLKNSAGSAPGTVSVTDIAANISGAALDTLSGDTQVAQIIVSDSGSNQVKVSAAQLTSDAHALNELYLSDGATPAHVTVFDTGDNLSGLTTNVLASVAANGHVNKIVVASGTVQLTVAEWQTTDAAALAELFDSTGNSLASIWVADNSTNVTNALTNLNTDSRVVGVVVTSGEVQLDAETAATDAAAIAKLYTVVNGTAADAAYVSVSDSAANISTYFDDLNTSARVNSITITPSAALTLSAQQVAQDTHALAAVASATGSYSIAVTDSAANVGTYLGALAANGHVTSLGLSDTTPGTILSYSVSGSDGAALKTLFQALQANTDVSLALSGAASALETDFTAGLTGAFLGGLASGSVLHAVRVSATSVLVSDVPLLISDFGSLLQPLGVNDSALDVQNDLSSGSSLLLANAASIHTLTLSDSANTTLAYTVTGSEGAALPELLSELQANSHVTLALSGTASALETEFAVGLDNALLAGLGLAGVTVSASAVSLSDVAQLTSDFGSLLQPLDVSDSALAVQNDLSSGSSVLLANVASIHTLTLSDSADTTLAYTVSGSDGASLAGLLGKVQANSHVTLALSGTATNLEADFGHGELTGALLDGLNGTLKAVTVTATGTVLVSDLASLATDFGSLLQSVDVSDSALDVQNDLSSGSSVLLANAASIGTLALTDGSGATLAYTVTGAEGGSLATLLSKLQANSFVTLALSGAASALETEFAAGLNGALLGGLNTSLAGVTVSASQVLVSNVVQLISDFGSLLQPLGVSDSALAVQNDLSSGSSVLLANVASIQTLTLSDSANTTLAYTVSGSDGHSLAALLGKLQANSHVALALSGTATALENDVGIGQLSSALLNSLSLSGVTVTATGTVLASDVATLTGDFGSLLQPLDVSDSATGVYNNLGGLETAVNAGEQLTISLTGGNPTLTLTEAQYNADLGALNDITGSYNIALTSVQTTDAATLASAPHVTSLSVGDTGAHIQRDLDALNTNTKVTSIVISDNAALSLTAHAAVDDSTAIGLLHNANSNPVALTVSDTAANDALYLNQLNGEGNISSIVISDDDALQLTAAQIDDSSAIGKLINADGAVNAPGVIINVADSAANISGYLNDLETSATSYGYLSNITIDDNLGITVDIAQLAADSTVLGLLQNANNTAVSLIVEDTAANIQDNAAALAQDDEITGLVISNNAAISLDVAAYQTDAGTPGFFDKLSNADNAISYSIDIEDGSGAISGVLDSLSADAHVKQIKIDGGGPLAVTVAQITSDARALGVTENTAGSAYTLAVTDAAATLSGAFGDLNSNTHVAEIIVQDDPSNEVTLLADAAGTDTTAESKLYQSDGSTPAYISVTDTSSAISHDFDALNGNIHVNAITIQSGGALALSATQVTGDTTAIGEIQAAYSIDVSDTASNIASALNGLQSNGNVASITVSDNQEITVTVAQLTSDSTILGKLHNQNGGAVHVIVQDTAADIGGAAFDALSGNSLVNQIVVSDSASNQVTISASQLVPDATALGELRQSDGTTPASVTVSDTAGDIASAFGALGAATVGKIIVSDSSSNEVTLSAAVAAADTVAEGKLYLAGGTVQADVAVDDSNSAISAVFDSLSGNSNVDHITINSGALTLTASQVADDSLGFAKITGLGYAVDVSDTSANIARYFGALNGNTSVESITPIDGGPISLTYQQAYSDTGAIDNLQAKVEVVDSGANIILENLLDIAGSAYSGDTSESELAGITINDSAPLAVTSIAQLGEISAAISAGSVSVPGGLLSLIDGAYTLAVSDLAANISESALDTLQGLATAGHLASLTVTNSEDLAIDVAGVTRDAGVLALTSNAGDLPYKLAVTDTAAHIAGALDALQLNSHVDTIALSDPADAMTLTAAQYANDSGALAKITTGYSLDVTGVAAANAATLAGDTHVTSIAVTDTAGDLSAPVLTSLGALGTVASITVSGGDLSLSQSQYQSAGVIAGLHKIVSGYLVDLNTVSASAAGTLALDAHVESIAVSDTGANVVSALVGLASVNKPLSIILTDASTPLGLTATQYETYGAVLSDIGSYTLDVSGATASQAASIGGNSHVVGLTVTASAAAVQGALGGLESVVSKLTSVTLSDGGTPTITVSEAAYNADSTALAKIVSNFDLTITGANAGDVSTLSSSVAADTEVQSFSILVSDTASAIATAIGQLDSSHVTSVTISSGGAVILSAAAAVANASAIAKIASQDGQIVDVSDTGSAISANVSALNGLTGLSHIVVSDNAALTLTGAEVLNDGTALANTVNANGSPVSIEVSDTAADITAAGVLAALQANSNISSIAVSGGPLTLTVAQFVANSSAISEMTDGEGHELAITIDDTAADITANLSLLSADTQVTDIVVSPSSPLTVSIGQLQGAAIALGKIGGLSLTVQDTASALQGHFDLLQTTASLHSIVVANSLPLTVSAATIANDGGALAHVSNRNGAPVVINVSDTAANVATYLSQLSINASEINSLTVTGGPLEVSVAQYTAYSAFLDLKLSSYVVSDSAANLGGAALGQLSDGKISSIVIADNGVVQGTIAQLTPDATEVAKLQNANASAVKVGIADSTSAIEALTAADIAALVSSLSISSVVDTDTGGSAQTLVLSVAQAQAFAAGHVSVSAPTNYAVVVSDAAATLGALTTANITAFGTLGVASLSSNNGAVSYSAAQAAVLGAAGISLSGGNVSVGLDGTVTHAVVLLDTNGNSDTVTGSHGNIELNHAQAAVSGGGDQITLDGSTSDAVVLSNTDNSWDAVTGSNGAVTLDIAQASVVGGGDQIVLDGSSSDWLSLYSTDNVSDAVTGSNASIIVNAAQASILGGNDQIYLDGSASDAVSLSGTGGVWDTVRGSGGSIAVNDAQASIVGGNDQISLDGSVSDAVSLYNTAGVWDTVTGSNGAIGVSSAQASIVGGHDRIFLDGSTSDAVSLYDTSGAWDTITGSDGSVNLTAAQASILGGNNWIYLDGSTSNAVTLYDTYGAWDAVKGSNGSVSVDSAQASIIGGSETVFLDGSSSDAVSLYATNGNWDIVNGSNGAVTLNGAQATLIGSNDSLYLNPGSTASIEGNNETLVFQQASYGNNWVTGFNSSDVLTFSKTDWANFSALLASGNIAQSGGNTVISIDGADSVTLYNVSATSLTSAQFKFV